MCSHRKEQMGQTRSEWRFLKCSNITGVLNRIQAIKKTQAHLTLDVFSRLGPTPRHGFGNAMDEAERGAERWAGRGTPS